MYTLLSPPLLLLLRLSSRRILIKYQIRIKSAVTSYTRDQWQYGGSAPRYLQEVIQPVAEVTSRRRLRSSSSSALLVPVTRRTTLGDRAFAVAGPRAWNTLPDFITDCSSSRTFKQYLKTDLFSLSFWAHNNTLFYDRIKRPSSSLCRLRRFKIVHFTLHYNMAVDVRLR